ncbi:MAG: hypothetical protein GY861_13095 [bacterium]|nr:hypothetical protein [bacterium]
MITPTEFKQSQTVVRCILEVVFHPQYELDFKTKVLAHNGWKHEEYQIERMHMSGYNFRLSLKHNDGREKELYIHGDDVYSWYRDLGKTIIK